MTVTADAITSLADLRRITLTKIANLILLTRSLARASGSEKITVTLDTVDYLQLDNNSIANWRHTGSQIIIKNIKTCNMTRVSLAPYTQMSSLKFDNVSMLVIGAGALGERSQIESIEVTKVDSLVIGEGALGGHSQIERIEATAVNSLTLRTDAFASNITVQDMKLNEVKNLTIQSGAFARMSSIENAVIRRIGFLQIESDAIEASINELEISSVTKLTMQSGALAHYSSVDNAVVEGVNLLEIDSSAIEANITELTIRKITTLSMQSGAFAQNSHIDSTAYSAREIKLTIADVRMEACENNTFGDAIQSMSLASLNLSIAKTGCMSVNTVWGELIVESSRLDNIESYAIDGAIETVQIKNSTIGSIETEGLMLHVEKFSIENSTMGKVSERAFAVNATSCIALDNCKIDILRKHAFIMLNLSAAATDRIRIQHLQVKQPHDDSMSFHHGTNFLVSQLDLGTPCACNMSNLSPQLGKSFRYGSSNHPARFHQTRCTNGSTPAILEEFQAAYCPDPTTSSSSTAGPDSTSTDCPPAAGGRRSPQCERPLPQARPPPPGAPGTGQAAPASTGGVNSWVLLGTLLGAALLLVAVAVVLVRQRLAPLWRGRHRVGRLQGRRWLTQRRPWLRLRQTSDSSQRPLEAAGGVDTGALTPAQLSAAVARMPRDAQGFTLPPTAAPQEARELAPESRRDRQTSHSSQQWLEPDSQAAGGVDPDKLAPTSPSAAEAQRPPDHQGSAHRQAPASQGSMERPLITPEGSTDRPVLASQRSMGNLSLSSDGYMTLLDCDYPPAQNKHRAQRADPPEELHQRYHWAPPSDQSPGTGTTVPGFPVRRQMDPSVRERAHRPPQEADTQL